jgi:hypothetical protein
MEDAKHTAVSTPVVENPQFPEYSSSQTTPPGPVMPIHAPTYAQQGVHGAFQTGTAAREQIEANERQERARIIQRLQRLNARKDFPSIEFRESDNISTLRRLNSVATAAGRAKMSIDLIKRCTIFLARVLEGLCERFPNKYVDLKGYSEHLLLSISQYDALLYDVYEFYSDTLAEMSPLLTYIGAIGSNLVMYSISRRIMGAGRDRERAEAEAKRREQAAREDEILQMLAARSRLAAVRQERGQQNVERDQRDKEVPAAAPNSKLKVDLGGPDESDNESVGFKSVKSVEFAEKSESSAGKVTFSDIGIKSDGGTIKIDLSS